MRIHQSVTTTAEIDGIEFELENSVDPSTETRYKRVGDQMVIGFLVDDDEPMRLEDFCGMGHIYSSHRMSTTLSEFLEALGLDRHGDRDPDLVEDHPDTLRDIWVDLASDGEHTDEFSNFCESQPPEWLTGDTLAEKARKFWDKTGGETMTGRDAHIGFFEFTSEAYDKAYDHLVSEGKIGNPLAVMLDVYEHGLVRYSVSGAGPQCLFDTARGGALWVPDDESLSEIERRAKVYEHGLVVSSMTRKDWGYQVDNQDPVYGFSDWVEAFNALKECVGEADQPSLSAKRIAARELAAGTADVYTDICNGSVYGVAVEVHQIEACDGEQEDGGVIEKEAIFGIIGRQAAEQDLEDTVTAFAKDAAESA